MHPSSPCKTSDLDRWTRIALPEILSDPVEASVWMNQVIPHEYHAPQQCLYPIPPSPARSNCQSSVLHQSQEYRVFQMLRFASYVHSPTAALSISYQWL